MFFSQIFYHRYYKWNPIKHFQIILIN